jgi:hypothetical protein
MTAYPAYTVETMLANLYWDQLMREPRYADPLRLQRFGGKSYCQNDEDGILAEIFRRIGTASRRFVEIGVQDGRECNSLALLMQGWRGTWIEASAAHVADARRIFAQLTGEGRLEIREAFVTVENAAALVGQGPLDLLSIDIDGNDWHVWKALHDPARGLFREAPRVVVVEYNASWAPPIDAVMAYKADYCWTDDGDNRVGASLCAFERLGRENGYALVGCSASGVNAFFVREDLAEGRFLAPFDAATHFEPPRYFLYNLHRGHRPGFGLVTLTEPRR